MRWVWCCHSRPNQPKLGGMRFVDGEIYHGFWWSILIVACLMLGTAYLARAEEPHDHGAMGAAGEFYSKWLRPKGDFVGVTHRGYSCCSRSDCSPVIELETRDGQVWARVELAPDTWYRVPRSIIESNQIDPRETPDGRAHACIIAGIVACYVEGGGV